MAKIQQLGTPEEIYNEPANRYVAEFIGESNIIPGRMIQDKKVKFDDIVFDCVDVGFKKMSQSMSLFVRKISILSMSKMER